MSTQRRANRTTPTIEVDRASVRRRWFRGCMERAGISIPGLRTSGSDITAPRMSIIWLALAWLFSGDELSQEPTDWVATNSLLSDHCFETFAELGSLSSSPPRSGAGGQRLSLPQATHRLSLPHIPILPVRTHLHPTLPHAPAGEIRWAERHDGKRDLYFQHAA